MKTKKVPLDRIDEDLQEKIRTLAQLALLPEPKPPKNILYPIRIFVYKAFLKWYFRPIIARQEKFNKVVVSTLNDLVKKLSSET